MNTRRKTHEIEISHNDENEILIKWTHEGNDTIIRFPVEQADQICEWLTATERASHPPKQATGSPSSVEMAF